MARPGLGALLKLLQLPRQRGRSAALGGKRTTTAFPALPLRDTQRLLRVYSAAGPDADLDLSGSAQLRALPEGLKVRGGLKLTGCGALSALPAGLEVGGDLDLRDCSNLKALPSGLSVGGDLKLGVTTSVPEPLDEVRAALRGARAPAQPARGAGTGVACLPQDARLGGLLAVDCPRLNSLPEQLELRSRLYLARCRRLARLPSRLVVGGDCVLTGLSALVSLPAKLRVKKACWIVRCPALQRLDSCLSVGGSLTFSQCHQLEELPAQTEVGGDLAFRECPNLLRLPDGLRVPGDLDLRGCRDLARLPRGLKVGRHLLLNGCAALRELPADLEVGSVVDLGDAELRRIPDPLRRLRFASNRVPLSERLVFHPESITLAEIFAESDAELRRALLARYGLERFISKVKADVLDRDRDRGGERQLLRVRQPHDEDLVCLQVHCPSTGALYILRVPPTMRTCRQAAAWTAGFDEPGEYRPQVET